MTEVADVFWVTTEGAVGLRCSHDSSALLVLFFPLSLFPSFCSFSVILSKSLPPPSRLPLSSSPPSLPLFFFFFFSKEGQSERWRGS